LASAAEEVRKLGEIIKLSLKEEQAQKGFRQLAVRLREDNKYAYLPRVLAEAGLLPGYSFPGDPGSVSLGYDPAPIFAGRLIHSVTWAASVTTSACGSSSYVSRMEEELALSPGFPLCPICGEYFKHHELIPKKKKKKDDSEKDARSRIDAHAKRCTGSPKPTPWGINCVPILCG